MEKMWRRGAGGCHGDEYGVGEEDYELDEDEEMGKGLNVDVLEEVDNNLLTRPKEVRFFVGWVKGRNKNVSFMIMDCESGKIGTSCVGTQARPAEHTSAESR